MYVVLNASTAQYSEPPCASWIPKSWHLGLMGQIASVCSLISTVLLPLLSSSVSSGFGKAQNETREKITNLSGVSEAKASLQLEPNS